MERSDFISKSPSDTWGIGEEIGRQARSGDLYALYGELGAGKTQLVKGIARGLGVEDWQYVVSPSFTLMNLYEGRLRLCHVDLYRIDEAEAELLDVGEFLDEGIVVVEWAERGNWDQKVTRVFLEVLGEDERRIIVQRQAPLT
jgi:tRNA threonylcarbamoyladenosine biosynthesis protein TsaE